MRLRALLEGKVRAAAVMEPFLSFAEMEGHNLVSLAYYNGMVVAGDNHDADTMGKIQGVLRRAVDLINEDKSKYAHLLLNDLPEDLRPRMGVEDLHIERLRYVYPAPLPRWTVTKSRPDGCRNGGSWTEGSKPEKVLNTSC